MNNCCDEKSAVFQRPVSVNTPWGVPIRQWEKPWFQFGEAGLMLPKLGRCFTHQPVLKESRQKNSKT
jgi:hypothetical protein